MSDAELGMAGYVMFRKDIIGNRGDGVILYVHVKKLFGVT